MRKPASLTRFLIVACYSVCVVQAIFGGLLAFYMVGGKLLGTGGWPFPTWLIIVNGIVSILAVAFQWIQYRRGHLDEYDNRRRWNA
ncbi:MAG: hypothetical protein Rubg2KO_22160 [Rubricoccaceae bacterium]